MKSAKIVAFTGRQLLTVLGIVALMGCAYSPRAKHGPRITSYDHLYKVGLAIRDYRHQHGEFPLHLSDLVPEYLSTNRMSLFYVTNGPTQSQILPQGWKENPALIDHYSSYVYLGTNGVAGIVAYERTNLWKSTATYPEKVAVLFSDFHVQYMPIAELQDRLR